MRHETAVRRPRTIAARCQQASGLWEDEPFLVGAYTFGAVLDARMDMEAVQVAFVLNLPSDELTWCAQPQSVVGLPHLLEIDKAPVEWYWRPALWPVSNHVIDRPLRIWSIDGPDTIALDALERSDAEPLRLPASTEAEVHQQLMEELVASLAHLQRVEAGYWERNWRNAHRGSGLYPENHLWDAITAISICWPPAGVSSTTPAEGAVLAVAWIALRDLGECLYPPLGDIWKVLGGHNKVSVIVQDHESANGRAGADQQIHTGQRSVRPSPQQPVLSRLDPLPRGLRHRCACPWRPYRGNAPTRCSDPDR